jgi:predicted dehydrogenase
MADRSPVRLAVWGIGYHAEKNVLPTVVCCDAVTLAGVYSRNQQRAREAVGGAGATVWPSPEAMLASPEVDAVYLCTPIGLHYEQGLAVVQAGKHLLCEKALTARAVDSLDLIGAARARNLALCEAFMYMFHPQFQALTDLVYAVDFGAIEALGCWFGMPKLENPGFRDSRALGGGGFLDLACYPISLAARLLDGGPQVTSAAVSNAEDEEVDMTGHATLRFSGGATAHLDWGFGRAYRNEVSIWGVEKSVFADRIFSKSPEQGSSIIARDQWGNENPVVIPPANAFNEMLNVFAQATWDSGTRSRLLDVAKRQAEIIASVEAVIHGNSGSSSKAHVG